MIEVRLYTENDENDWNNFISSSKNAAFFHHRNYLSYHSHRFHECSLIFKKKGKIAAVLPGNSNEREVVSHGGLSFAGLLMNKDLKMSDVLQIFDLLKQYYHDLGYEKLIYKTIPTIFHKYPSQEDLYALFRNNAVLVRRDISSCIYLPEQIRFSETKRQLVRKCVRDGIQFAEQKNFTEYWKLLTNVVAQHNVTPTHTLEEITILNQRFPNNIRLFEARDNEQLLAGVVIFDFSTVVHTQYMVNSIEGRERGALDFLIHKLVDEVYGNRQYFNFGISTEKAGHFLNHGLIQQKELMGGRGIVYDFYELSLI
jgi:hypothetical protein